VRKNIESDDRTRDLGGLKAELVLYIIESANLRHTRVSEDQSEHPIFGRSPQEIGNYQCAMY